MDSESSGNDLSISQENTEKAKQALDHIVKLLEQGPKNASSAQNDRSCGAAQEFVTLTERIEKTTVSRMTKKRKNSWAAKTKWALYKRDEYFCLVQSIEDFINDLCALFPAQKGAQIERDLCAEEASILAQDDEQLLELLIQTIGDRDEKLQEESKKASKATTHQNTSTISGTNHGLALGQNYGAMSGFTFGGKEGQ
jgi:hypothetical protein